MENNWPETLDELLDECQRLIDRYDLYTLGERGEPFTGETEPRVDGTEYLAGEYKYGVAMIPAQWVTYVIEESAMGGGECEDVSTKNGIFKCSECGCTVEEDGVDWGEINCCPDCMKRVKR